jgi:succinate dehydrogenase/fumarate reductase-like Fe-S protein
MKTAVFKIWRGDANGGDFSAYTTEISEGMVVLDAVHDIQAKQANDLACRWNCKAGKCGSCSAEINGVPKLMCMTRLDAIPLNKPVTIEPMRAFPLIRDLTTDVSWNFRAKMLRTVPGVLPRQTLIVSRNFGNASNASFARTSATFCEIIICTSNSSDRAFWSLLRHWRCTRSTRRTAC